VYRQLKKALKEIRQRKDDMLHAKNMEINDQKIEEMVKEVMRK